MYGFTMKSSRFLSTVSITLALTFTYSYSSFGDVYANKPYSPLELGYQYIWDMHHFRWSLNWFYNTIGVENLGANWNDEGGATELIFGVAYRPFLLLGVFGGLGFRYAEYGPNYGESSHDPEKATGIRHELGIEVIIPWEFQDHCGFTLYITERNFHRIGGGIGYIFWR